MPAINEATREEQLLAALRQAYLSIQTLAETTEQILKLTKNALDSLEPPDDDA